MTGLQLNAVEELANIDKGRRLGAGVGRPPQAAAASARGSGDRPARAETPEADAAAPEPAVSRSRRQPLTPRTAIPASPSRPDTQAAANDPQKPSAATASPPLEITLTRLTKKSGPFTKKISLAANGSLRERPLGLFAGRRHGRAVKVAGVAGLGAVIEGLTPSQGLALGSPCART